MRCARQEAHSECVVRVRLIRSTHSRKAVRSPSLSARRMHSPINCGSNLSNSSSPAFGRLRLPFGRPRPNSLPGSRGRPVVYSSQVHPTPKRSPLQDKRNGRTSDVPVMRRCVQSGWARWWHGLQPMRVKREHNASDTRAKRGHNAKSNASLTRTNAGFCGSQVATGSGLGVVFQGVTLRSRAEFQKLTPCTS
jgi:hypothetical protein